MRKSPGTSVPGDFRWCLGRVADEVLQARGVHDVSVTTDDGPKAHDIRVELEVIAALEAQAAHEPDHVLAEVTEDQGLVARRDCRDVRVSHDGLAKQEVR